MFSFTTIRYCAFFSGAVLLIMGLTGCNPEARLAAAANNGEVLAQYELAIYYSESTPPQKTKSYEWMKRAATSRYKPAMRKLAEYYLTGYGTTVNYPRVAEWLSRYFEKERNSGEALAVGQKILNNAFTQQDIAAGFILCNIALTLENQNGNPNSPTARTAAGALLYHLDRILTHLLENRNYADAEKVLSFARKIIGEFPASFSQDAPEKVQKMQQDLSSKIESFSNPL